MKHAYFLAPSSFCFHFLKKEGGNEREKRLISSFFPPVPAPFLSERKKEENKMKRNSFPFSCKSRFRKKKE
jgi:hypothetical protein